MISVIIPTYNNLELLRAHLSLYKQQSLRRDLFEIIVVNDGGEHVPDFDGVRVVNLPDNGGAARTRNYGAVLAQHDVLLFVGDDCIPHDDLLLNHLAAHRMYPNMAVQGYTPFHPDVMDTPFMRWLDRSGMQAAWFNLRDKDGWKRNADGFCLTTNFSISKDRFVETGGFPERFKNAAWEDIAFSHELQRNSIGTIFEPKAVNLHYHRHTMRSFMDRQRREGWNRIDIGVLYPEFAASLLNPKDMRAALQISPVELSYGLQQVLYINGFDFGSEMQRLMSVCSYNGVAERIKAAGGVLRALPHINDPEYPAYILSALRGIEQGNSGYVEHCAEWGISKEPGNWASYAFAGECLAAIGESERALYHFQKSLEIEYSDWANERARQFDVEMGAE
jgi:GT2 family glycosyltransferase